MLDPALCKLRLENGIQCISRFKCKTVEVFIGSNLIVSAYLYSSYIRVEKYLGHDSTAEPR